MLSGGGNSGGNFAGCPSRHQAQCMVGYSLGSLVGGVSFRGRTGALSQPKAVRQVIYLNIA